MMRDSATGVSGGTGDHCGEQIIYINNFLLESFS